MPLRQAGAGGDTKGEQNGRRQAGPERMPPPCLEILPSAEWEEGVLATMKTKDTGLEEFCSRPSEERRKTEWKA